MTLAVPLEHHLIVGAALFVLGLVGFLTRRNLIVLFLSAEMMLQGVTLNLVAFGRHHGNLGGQVLTLFVITVAACEAGLALALILMLYRDRRTLDVSEWQDLREAGTDAAYDGDQLPPKAAEPPSPRLDTTGHLPPQRREESYV